MRLTLALDALELALHAAQAAIDAVERTFHLVQRIAATGTTTTSALVAPDSTPGSPLTRAARRLVPVEAAHDTRTTTRSPARAVHLRARSLNSTPVASSFHPLDARAGVATAEVTRAAALHPP